MSDVVKFADLKVSDEEKARRVMVEVTRLANLTPGEWKLWYRRSAEQLDMTPEELADLVEALIKDREQKTREKRAEEKLQEDRAERQRKSEAQKFREKVRAEDAAAKKARAKAAAFADIIKLPVDQQDGKIAELGKQLEEDEAALSAEFADYREAQTEADAGGVDSDWDVERWPEPVATAELLQELAACIDKHIIAKPHQVLIIALWVMLTWVHEVAAHHSPYLMITAPKEICGKTTLLVDVIRWLVNKPVVGAAYNAANIYRVADRDKPTMLFDNIDKLFARKPDVADLFLYGYTRGVKVPREEKIDGQWQTHWYDPFCPKAFTLIGMRFGLTKDDEAVLASRTLPIELLPKKKGEEVPKKPFAQGLLDEFANLHRKLARWSDDNATALKGATPAIPEAFFNRSADNWTLLWAIADLAGGDWAEQARSARRAAGAAGTGGAVLARPSAQGDVARLRRGEKACNYQRRTGQTADQEPAVTVARLWSRSLRYSANCRSLAYETADPPRTRRQGAPPWLFRQDVFRQGNFRALPRF
jgi:hypothetical protein